MRKGFTLIEVLIVVIILGILATIAVPQFVKIVEKARRAEAVTNISGIRTALAIYYLEEEGYQALGTASEIEGNLDVQVTENNWAYTVTAPTTTTYTVVATRDATSGWGGQTIIMDQAGAYTGNYEFVPNN
ncbi:type IV pilin protein [Candidatus Omnitrophota bacterium]